MGLLSWMRDIPIVGNMYGLVSDLAKGVGDETGINEKSITNVAKAATKDIPVVGDIVGAVDEEAKQNEQRNYNEGLATTAYERQMELQENQQDFNSSEAATARDFNAQQAAIARDFNAEQAAIARVYNAQQADKERTWQERMIEEQREYDSPAAQLERTLAAGLSPASLQFMDSPSPSGVSPASSSPASSSPASSSPASSGQGSAHMASSSLESAQIHNLESQSNLNDVQAEKNAADVVQTHKTTEWMDDLNKAILALNNVTVEKVKSETKVNEETARQVHNSADAISEQIEVYKQTVKKMQAETKGISIDNLMKAIQKDNLPQQLAATLEVSRAQAYHLYKSGFQALMQGQMIQFDLGVNKQAGTKYFVDRIRYATTEQKYQMRITKMSSNGTLPMSTYQKWQTISNGFGALSNGIATGVSTAIQYKTMKGVNRMSPSGGYSIPDSNLPFSY